MSESLFDIFGEHLTRTAVKKVTRQPFSNENMGKLASMGPIKSNIPVKNTGQSKIPKKSFLANTGKALQLQNTPVRTVFTPRSTNVGPLIYTDEDNKEVNLDEIEFTKPSCRYDTNPCELYDYLPEIRQNPSPQTMSPVKPNHDYKLDFSYMDDSLLMTDTSVDSLDDDSDLGLPELY